MDIFEAVRQGNAEEVSRLLDADPTLLEKKDAWRNRPLARAAKSGQLGVVQLLLQRGANMDASGGWGMTALHYAADKGREEVVSLLLSKGAKAYSLDDSERIPLMLAAYAGHVEVVKLLLPHVGSKDCVDRTSEGGRRQTALLHAIRGGHEDVVVFLLSAGAKAYSVKELSTPLQTAAGCGQLGIVQVLLQHIERMGRQPLDYANDEALHCAASGGHEEVCKFLLRLGVKTDAHPYGKTPLHSASSKGHVGVVQLLLQHLGMQALEERDVIGQTAVHYAVEGGHEEVLAFLLSQGAQAGQGGPWAFAPFLRACERGHVGVAKLLLEHQGEQVLEETNSQGRGAVHYAAEKGHEEILHFLLSQGAQANCRDDSDGQTPLMVGAARGKVGTVKMLLQHLGRQVLEETDKSGQTALHRAAGKEMVAFLLSQGADVHSKDKGGQTPLMFQCRRGGPDTVKLLLRHMGGQGLDAVDEEGLGVLSYAARNRREDLLREEVLQVLLLAGAGQGLNLRECLLDAQRVLPINGRCNVLKVLEWWEGELERHYLLQRARCLHDTFMAHRDNTTAPLPAFLQARAAAGQALPQVDVVVEEQEEQEAEASGKRKASSEAGGTPQEAERHATLSFVMTTLGDQLVTELMQGFHPPR